MEEEKYKQKMSCQNCGKKFTKEFLKGMGCSGYYTCLYCGCREALSVGLPDKELPYEDY